MNSPKKVAAITTEYRKWSHADVILRHLLDGYPGGGRPDLQLVSLYTDIVPKNDMSRELAKKHGFKITDTIAGALTLGGDSLAVDAVLSIGEHGKYPTNDKGQILYPRRRFFEEIMKVFEKSKKSVPVFSDKHLAVNWTDAKWMYDTARKLYVPFMAGSSIPVAWRRPNLVLPKGCEITGAVQIGYGPLEAYGFHAIEGLQCMVERRKLAGDAEPTRLPQQGVKAVTCHSGKAMWNVVDAQPWGKAVLEASAKLVTAHAAADIRTATVKAKDAATFEIEYRDGLRSLVVMANGWAHEGPGGAFIFAGQLKGREKPEACQFYVQGNEPFAHFGELVKAIDAMVRTGHASYPVERTLLTTGILEAVMTSRAQGGARVETPHLDVRYRPTDWDPPKGDPPPAPKRP